jgi:transcriptional regulator with XRE-family HTH domain
MNSKILAEKIKSLRKSAGLSQEQVAKMLKMTRPTYLNIENGSREITLSEAEQLAGFFSLSLQEFLAGSTGKNIIVDIEADHSPKKDSRIRINVPQKNANKFKEALLYILERVGAMPHVGQTVIYKLLYFIDFDYYEKYEEQLIGATYMKNRFGPTPIEFKKIVDSMITNGESTQIKNKYFKHDQTKYLPVRSPDLSVFSGREIEHINEVICRLGAKNASQLSDYSHEDVPWISTPDGSPIDYETVFYRTPKTSVRNYAD